jgi:hypothetical protein
MKTISILCSLFFISFFLSGCIEVNTTIKVNADGSGTVEETVFMSNEIINMIKEFASSFDSTGTSEEFTLFKESELKEKAANLGEGVEYISGEKITEEGKEGYRAIYSFEDINKLTIDQDPTSRIPDNPEAQQKQPEEYLTFGFIKGTPSEVIINMPSLQGETETEEEISETESTDTSDSDSTDLTQLKYFLKDFGFSLKVQVDGTISSTNATYIEGSSITIFSIDFGELLENAEKLKQLEKSNFQNLQQVKDLLIDIPGIKIETNNPVNIKFN